MILDELVLENFGVFAGRQVFDLTPPSSEQPVVLVGGLNGSGKTTFLEAVHLALYGPLSPPSSRRTRAYDAYLRSSMHHAASPSAGSAVELAFHTYEAGVARHYRIRRSWHDTSSKIREQLTVECDGRIDPTLTDTWAEQVEAFLPRGIAGLFFFDGEQIEALADLEMSRQVLKTAIASLLGLDLVDRLATDLAVLRRRHRSEGLPDDLRQRVEEGRRLVEEARHDDEVAAAGVASARNEVERVHKRLFELNEQYRAAGGELLDQRDEAQRRAATAREDIRRVEEELRDLAAGSAPLRQVAPLLSDLATQAHKEATAARQRLLMEIIDDRDAIILKLLREQEVNSSALQSLQQFLDDDQEYRRAAAETDNITCLDDPGALELLTTVTLPEQAERIRAGLRRRSELRYVLDDADRLLESIPHPDALAPLREQRDAVLDEQQRAEAALAHAEERLAAVRSERANREASYERAMDDAARATLTAEDDRRIVEHAERVQETLEDFRDSATSRHVDRICGLVLDSLQQLLRKETLVTGLTIDPKTYTVQLIGSDGQSLEAKRLSAGERQLLAVALLWGLARASGRPLPMIIDTPLGRLDQSHRDHLVKRYFPHASHQVILLSTDTEIDEQSLADLQPYVGHSYHLAFDPSKGASTVRPGYLWEV